MPVPPHVAAKRRGITKKLQALAEKTATRKDVEDRKSAAVYARFLMAMHAAEEMTAARARQNRDIVCAVAKIMRDPPPGEMVDEIMRQMAEG